MERAPLPPHERSWRHPSEVAADARHAVTAERPSTSALTSALVVGSVTIVLVGVAVLSLTPTGADGPTAMGSTPVQHVASAGLAGPTTVPASSVPVSLVPPTAVGPAPIGPRAAELGSGGLAVLPSRTVVELLERDHNGTPRGAPRIDLVGRSDRVSSPPVTIVVTLHNGTSGLASVVDAGDGDGIAVVRIDGVPSADGFTVAAEPPGAGDVVTVLADEPISVELRDVESVDAADGTPVVDGDGQLIGVYAENAEGEGGQLIPIDDELADAATARD